MAIVSFAKRYAVALASYAFRGPAKQRHRRLIHQVAEHFGYSRDVPPKALPSSLHRCITSYAMPLVWREGTC